MNSKNPARCAPLKIPVLKQPRSDSRLAQLPLAQRHLLERWLFVENVSYAQAVERIAQEFGVKTSTGAVRRFFETTTDRRLRDRAVQLHLKDYAPHLQSALDRLLF